MFWLEHSNGAAWSTSLLGRGSTLRGALAQGDEPLLFVGDPGQIPHARVLWDEAQHCSSRRRTRHSKASATLNPEIAPRDRLPNIHHVPVHVFGLPFDLNAPERGAEERSDVSGKKLRLLEGGEVAGACVRAAGAGREPAI